MRNGVASFSAKEVDVCFCSGASMSNPCISDPLVGGPSKLSLEQVITGIGGCPQHWGMGGFDKESSLFEPDAR